MSQAELDWLYAQSDALRAESARLRARTQMPLSVAQRNQNTALIVANTARINANTAAIYAAKGIRPPQSAPLAPAQVAPVKKKTSFMGWVVVVIGAFVIIGWISSAVHPTTSTSQTSGYAAIATATLTPNRYTTDASGHNYWNGIPAQNLTGNEWVQMNTIEQAAYVVVMLTGTPYCTELPSQGVDALNAVYGPVANRAVRITDSFGAWLVLDGCRHP